MAFNSARTQARHIPFCISFLTVLLCAGTIARAQDRLDPVGVGKARASVATVRGIGAVASNPGALGLGPISALGLKNRLVVSFYTVGGTIGSTYLSGDEFQDIFANTANISNSQRERIGSLLQDEKLFANGGINLLTAYYETEKSGAFGLYYGHRAYARVNFPDDLAKLIATSNITGQDFTFANRGLGADWVTELGLAWGTNVKTTKREREWFPEAGFGGTLKLVQGVAHFDITDNSLLTITQINVNGQLQFKVQGGYVFRSAEPDNFAIANAPGDFQAALFPGSSGIGVGFDFGISGVLHRRAAEQTEPLELAGAAPSGDVFYGLTITNLGGIKWNNKTRERRAVQIVDTLGARLSNQEFELFEGELQRVADFSTSLPSVFRAGLGFDAGLLAGGERGTWIVDIEGEVPLNDVPGNSPDPRVSVGGEWAASKWLALRTGLSAGGVSDVALGLGVGIYPTEWLAIDLGTAEINALVNGKRLDAAARIAVGFNP